MSRIRVLVVDDSDVVCKIVADALAGDQEIEVIGTGPMVNFSRPSIDVLFHSAARVFPGGLLAVVLTGMGSDGLGGSEAVVASGGTVLAQDEASSVVWGMPGAVVKAGLAQRHPMTLPAG